VSLVQDPIEPGETFEYEYVIPDPGTHWYHPHIRTNVQVERGLHGGMVIHESNGVEVDRDRLFMLDDIDLQPNGALAPFDLDEGIGLDATWGRLGNLMLVNGISVREEPITDLVISGGVERWRLVNNANARTMYIEINGAQWRLIARDGTLIQEPQTLERLQIAAGQRVDLEVLPGESEVDLQIFTRNKEQEGEVFEEIHAFEGVPDRPQEPGEWKEWDPPTFIDMEDASQGVSLLFDGEETSNGNSMEWTINGEMWDAANDLEVLEAGTPSTITVTNDSDYVHPFHMHGNFFQVISIDGEPPDYSARYDTVMVDPQSEIKLYTDFVNPGKWMAHCHILEHAALGMMTAFNVQESKR